MNYLYFKLTYYFFFILEEETSDTNNESVLTEEYATPDIINDVNLPHHMRCAVHTLNLISTTDIQKELQQHPNINKIHNEVLTRCNGIWRLLRSPKKREQIINILGKSIPRPVPTRWNSLFDALEALSNSKTKLNDVCNALEIHSFTENDFIYMEEFINCCRPIAKAIDLLQGDKYCYFGILLSTLLAIRQKLIVIHDSTNLKYFNLIVQGI